MAHAVSAIDNEQSEEQSMLRDSAATFCAREATIDRLKTLKESHGDYDPQTWRSMVELGWTGILVPEEAGGLGLDMQAAAVVAEELGRVAAPEPFLESGCLAPLVLNDLPTNDTILKLQEEIANGNCTAVACVSNDPVDTSAPNMTARAAGGGYVLEGSIDCVPYAADATVFLVQAKLLSNSALFVVAADSGGITRESVTLADNTKHSTLRFNACHIDEGNLLSGDIDISRAFDTYHVLAAAYLFGLMSAAFEITTEYLSTRKQFGRTIGSFQSLQHRAVDLFILRQLTSSVLGDATQIVALNSDSHERAMAASRAKYRAADCALAITRAAIQLHGAIGFTFECNIGHFLNRALVISARHGNANWHLRRLSRLINPGESNRGLESNAATQQLTEPEDGNWNELPDEEFRQIIRQWFEQEYPTELRYPPRRFHWPEIRDWYLKLSAKGWLAPSWPTEYGGMGLSPAKVLIFIEEQERWGVARAPDMGIIMIGPLLIQHGTQAQCDHYLPKILAGENIWCQGYSEPNAGSDLASLQCEAILDGDEFVVNGQKTWTTLAQDATDIFLLVRTDKTVKKQKGISFLLVKIDTPGITIRPIKNIAGDEEFCEVFFENVRVPAENIVGELNTGWSIAKALLGFERIFLGSPKQSQYALQRLSGVARGMTLFDDPAFVDRYMRLYLDVADLESIYSRYAQVVRDGGTLGPDVSMLKIWATETFARLSELMVEAAGEFGAQRGKIDFNGEEIDILSQFYNARPATIYGGSNEIQRNILAKNVLALPDD